MEKLDRTCSICLYDCKQPKLLTCLHVYCCQCLFDYVNKSLQDGQFQCPLCREQIQLPSGGVEEFQDFSEGDDVSGIDDIVDTSTETDDVSDMDDATAPAADTRLCDVCESQTIVKYRCKDCKKTMCDVCQKIHSKIPLTKNHVIVDFVDNQNTQTNDTPVDLCSVHKSKPIEIYCVECKTYVCLQCYIDESNRGVHNGHRILNFDDKDTRTKLRDDLKCFNTNLQAQIDRLQEFSDHLTSKLSEIDICSEEACNKVDQQVQIISTWAQSRAEQIKTQINNTRHEERNKLETLEKEMEMSTTKLKSDIKDALITLKGKSVVKIVERNEKNKKDEMKVKEKDLVVPGLHFPGFLPGNDVRYEVEKLFGKCKNLKQQNFTLLFNINNFGKVQERYFKFGEFEMISGVNCSGKTLEVYLLSKENDNKKVKIEYNFTILNKDARLSRSGAQFMNKIQANVRKVHYLIDFEELKNPKNGFVDKDGNFSIRILLREHMDKCEMSSWELFTVFTFWLLLTILFGIYIDVMAL